MQWTRLSTECLLCREVMSQIVAMSGIDVAIDFATWSMPEHQESLDECQSRLALEGNALSKYRFARTISNPN